MLQKIGIIIGAMKAGTTSLFLHLSEHPQICACPVKEPDFFSKEENWIRGIQYYESLWRCLPSHTVALEASTNYTKHPHHPHAAERIASTGRDFRFVYMLRDPIHRIESHLNHGIRVGWWTKKDLGDATVEDYPLDISRYAMQLDMFRHHFNRDQILLIAFEDFVKDPGTVLRNVCNFLEINPDFIFQSLHTVYGSTSRVDHPLYHRLHSIPGMRRIAKMFSQQFRETAREIVSSQATNTVKLSEQQRRYVKDELHDDLYRLNSEYGFDTSPWEVQP